MSSKALRRTAATLLLVFLTAFSAAPAHAVPEWMRRGAGPEPAREFITFLIRLILKADSGGSGDTTTTTATTTTTTTTNTTTTTTTTRQDAGGAMDPNGGKAGVAMDPNG